MSFVQSEHFDGVHVVRVPLSNGEQTTPTSTTMDGLWVFDRVLVRQQIADVASGRREHADPRAVVGGQDVSAQVDRQPSRPPQPAATFLPPSTRPYAGHRDHGRRQRSTGVSRFTPEQEPTTCK